MAAELTYYPSALRVKLLSVSNHLNERPGRSQGLIVIGTIVPIRSTGGIKSFGGRAFPNHMLKSFGGRAFPNHMLQSFGGRAFPNYLLLSFGGLAFPNQVMSIEMHILIKGCPFLADNCVLQTVRTGRDPSGS
jgi:hypothetical protein